MYTNMKKTEAGYYRYSKIPESEDLKNLYEEYYPKEEEENKNYKVDYTEGEIEYINNEFKKIHFIENKLNPKESKSLLDIGCGEGFSLKFFEEKGYNIEGIDFNEYACETHNKSVIDKVRVGDFYKIAEKLIEEEKKFDLIICKNVLEHVVSPEELIKKAFKLLNKGGILLVRFPNDFSILQKYLLEKKYVEKPYWISIPDHLNYFTLDSLKNLGNNLGLSVIDYYSDFPIDINLLNENTNYVRNPELGRNCGKARIELENLIMNISLENTINLGRSFAELGLGRNISVFYRKV